MCQGCESDRSERGRGYIQACLLSKKTIATPQKTHLDVEVNMEGSADLLKSMHKHMSQNFLLYMKVGALT